MSWLLIRASDGAIIAGPVEEEPVPADGQYVREVLVGYGTIVRWSPQLQGFVDIPELDSAGWLTLHTPAEWKAIKTLRSTNMQVDYTWTWIEQSPSFRLSNPIVQQGVAAAVTAGKLTAARAAQILAGAAPT